MPTQRNMSNTHQQFSVRSFVVVVQSNVQTPNNKKLLTVNCVTDCEPRIEPHAKTTIYGTHTSMCCFSSVWFLSLDFYDDGTRRSNVKFEACHSAALTCWRDSHRVESKLAQHERCELDVCPDRAGALQPLQSRACGATPLGTIRSSTAHGRNVIRRG